MIGGATMVRYPSCAYVFDGKQTRKPLSPTDISAQISVGLRGLLRLGSSIAPDALISYLNAS